MYFAVVALTMFLLPIGSILVEQAIQPDIGIIGLIGRWFVFWAVGVRLGLAGLRQLFQPAFTAREIFHMEGEDVLPLVRELGVANAATAVVGLLSLGFPTFALPVALSSAIFYGVAGVRHAFEQGKSRNEVIAMVSDLFVAAVLALFVWWALGR